MADLEGLLDQVFEKLQLVDVTQLGECCVQLNVQIPPAKTGKKSAIKALILKYLTSDAFEEDEHAEDIVTALNVTLDRLLGGGKTDLKVDEEGASKSEAVETAAVKPEEKGETSSSAISMLQRILSENTL